MHQLTDEQLASIITWAKNTPEGQAVFLCGSRATGTAGPESQVELALLIKGQDPLTRLATFIIHRRGWRAELETALGLAVQLERARSEATPEASYVELWRRED
jgi:predicted nucleotidyltransferase